VHVLTDEHLEHAAGQQHKAEQVRDERPVGGGRRVVSGVLVRRHCLGAKLDALADGQHAAAHAGAELADQPEGVCQGAPALEVEVVRIALDLDRDPVCGCACLPSTVAPEQWLVWLAAAWLAGCGHGCSAEAGRAGHCACLPSTVAPEQWLVWLAAACGWLAGYGWAWLTDVAWLAEWLWVKPWCVEVSVMHLQWRGELSAEVSGWHRLPGNRKKPVLFSHRGYTGQDFLGELSSLLTVNLSCFFC